MNRLLAYRIFVFCLGAAFAVGVLIYGFATGFGLEAFSNKENKYTSSYSYSADVTDITSIEIDWLSGSVEFRLGSGKEIKIKESSVKKLSEKDKLITESKDGVFKVSWNDEPWYTRYGLFKNSKKLVVVVPKTMALSSVAIKNSDGQIATGAFVAGVVSMENSSGNIKTKEIKAGRIRLKSDMGNITATKLLTADLNISAGSGNINVIETVADASRLTTVSGKINSTGAAFDVRASSVLGDVDISSGVMPEKISVGTASGKLNLIIPENEGFILNKETITGKLVTSIAIQNEISDSFYKNPSSSNKVELKTTSGDMSLEKGNLIKSVTTYADWNEARKAKAAK